MVSASVPFFMCAAECALVAGQVQGLQAAGVTCGKFVLVPVPLWALLDSACEANCLLSSGLEGSAVRQVPQAKTERSSSAQAGLVLERAMRSSVCCTSPHLVILGVGELQGQLGGLNVKCADAGLSTLQQVCPLLQRHLSPLQQQRALE